MADHKKDDGHGKPDDSHGKPKDGDEATAIAAKTALTGFFAKVFNINWDTVVQVGAPKLRREAERLANGAKKTFAVDHWSRSDAAEIAYNALVTNLKTAIAGLPNGLVKAGMKELLDFSEVFINKFCNEDEGTSAGKSSEKSTASFKDLPTELQTAITKANVEIIGDGVELIKATPPSGRKAMMDDLTERADSLWNLQDRLLNGPPKPEVPKEPSVPFSERLSQCGEAVERTLKPFNEELERDIAQLKAKTERKRAEQQAKRVAEPDTFTKRFWGALF